MWRDGAEGWEKEGGGGGGGGEARGEEGTIYQGTHPPANLLE